MVGTTNAQTARGERLRALRLAIGERLKSGLSHDVLVTLSEEAARKLGDGYKPLERTNYCHIENGRLQLTLDSTRGVLCAVFGLTRDELADYLDGRQGLPAVLAARSAREASRPSRRTKAHPRQKQSAPHV